MSYSKCTASITSLLLNPDNPLDICDSFQNEDQILSFFNVSSMEDIFHNFEFAKNFKSYGFKAKFNKIDLRVSILIKSLITNLNGLSITTSDAGVLGKMLGVQLSEGNLSFERIFDDKKIYRNDTLNFLSKVNFKHLKVDGEFDYNEHIYSGRLQPGISLSEYTFARELIENLSEDHLLGLFNERDSDVFIKYADIIYRQAMELNIYTFEMVDVRNFKDQKLSLSSMIPYQIRYGSDRNGELIPDVIDILTIKLEQEILSPQDVNKFLSGQSRYSQTLKKFPKLKLNNHFASCVMLEQLDGHKRLNFPTIDIFDLNSPKETLVIGEAINNLEFYPQEKRVPILLSYIYNQLDVSSENSDTLLNELTKHASDQVGSEIELVKNTQNLLLVLSKKEELRKDILSEMMLGYFLGKHEFPDFEFINFVAIESYDWWDHGSKEVPNSFHVESYDSMSELVQERAFYGYTMFLKSCYSMGFHKVIAGESCKIAKACSSAWKLGEIKSILIKSLTEMTDEDIANIDEQNKLAAFYVASAENKDLGMRILKHLGVIKSSYLDEFMSEVQTNFNLNKILADNYTLFSKVLTHEFNPKNTDVYDLFSDIIGRQKREVEITTLTLSYCISQSIAAGAIGKSIKIIRVSNIENEERIEDTDYLYIADYERSRRRNYNHFVRCHFPRLKASSAHEKIAVLYDYLLSKKSDILETESCGIEGVIAYGNALYVFGEFKWSSIIEVFLEMKKRNIIFITINADENGLKVVETKLSLDEVSIGILFSHFDAVSLNLYKSSGYLTGTPLNVSNFRKTFERLLPKIDYMGLALNDRS